MTGGRRRLLVEDAPLSPHTGLVRHMTRSCSTSGGAHSGHEQNITLIMIVVILVFMLCNAPARLVQVTRLLIILMYIIYLFTYLFVSLFIYYKHRTQDT